MKVLIGIGTCDKFDYCEKPVFDSIFSQDYPNFDVLIVDNSQTRFYSSTLLSKYPKAKILHLNRPRFFRDAVGQARKAIKDYALSNRYDRLFFVDADMLLKKDSLSKLMKHDKDFVTGAIGYLHDKKNRTTVFRGDKFHASKVPGQDFLIPILYGELDNLADLTKIESCGLSCCLIKTHALSGMDFFISHTEMAFLEDRIFCRDLKQKGIELFLDKNVRPEHWHRFFKERFQRLK